MEFSGELVNKTIQSWNWGEVARVLRIGCNGVLEIGCNGVLGIGCNGALRVEYKGVLRIGCNGVLSAQGRVQRCARDRV
jgi:hypothetical protein